MAVIFSLVAWVATRPAGGPAKDPSVSSPSPSAGAAASSTGDGPSTAAGPVARHRLAADLALLPGLNGPWWFEETPWLTPFLRQAIAAKVLAASVPLAAVLGDRPQAYFDSNPVEVQKWLWEAAGRCRGDLSPGQWQLVERLKTFSDGNHDDDAQATRVLDEALREFTEGPGGRPAAAADLHTAGLLQHRIAMLDHDAARAQAAKKSYDKALHAYSREKQTPASTRLLCLVDAAVLSAEMLGDANEAKRQLDEALAAGDLPVLFQVSTLTARGDLAAASAANSGEYEDYRFVFAKKVLARTEAVRSSHPLAAYVAERHAWSLMDQWKVEEASKQFQAAYHIRLSDKEDKNPLASIYVLHDRHGLAMASRYRGNLDSARRNYKTVVDEIKAALADARRRQGADGATRRAPRPPRTFEQLPGTLGRLRTLQRRRLRRKGQPAPGRRILRRGPPRRARMERCGGDGL